VMLGLQRSVGNRALGRSLAASPAHIPVLQHTPVVQRQKSSPPKIRFDRKAIETVRTNAESRHDSITSFIQWSRGNLQSYRSRLLSAAAIYKEAFKRHKRVLDSAGEAARDRAELISTPGWD